MAPRTKAGPNIGSRIRVQVSDEEWRQFALAIDPDAAVADRTRLPGGHSLRLGLQKTIESVLGSGAGPTTREVKADLLRFREQIQAAFVSMPPGARKEFFYEGGADIMRELADALRRAVAGVDEIEQDERSPGLAGSNELFLANVIWLVGSCPDIRTSLPSKAYYNRADTYPVYRAARAAAKIACALGARHAPGAVPKLNRLLTCKKSTFVSKLLRARRRPVLISQVLEVTKPPAE